MTDILQIAKNGADIIKSKGGEGFVRASVTEKKEFNLEGKEFTLYRTLFDENVVAEVITEKKKGTYATNKVNPDAVEMAVNAAFGAAEGSVADDCNAIAEYQGEINDSYGAYESDEEKLFARTKELRETLINEYKKIAITQIIVAHKKIDSAYANTNGTVCVEKGGFYDITVEISGNDGTKTTGLVYSSVYTSDLDKPFIEIGDVRYQVETAIKQLEAAPITEKFTGTMLCTPGVLGMMMSCIVSMAGGSSILEKTSIWIDKLGQKIADSKLSIKFVKKDDRMVFVENLFDGYKTEDAYFIKNGVLESFQIGDFISRKTGFKRAAIGGENMIVENGDQPLDDIIKGIKKGIIVGDFSGGEPGVNGEFSGIAKNSFLIEDGKITKPLSETMINGNFADCINNLSAISKETVCNGTSVLPWMAFDGVVVSGK